MADDINVVRNWGKQETTRSKSSPSGRRPVAKPGKGISVAVVTAEETAKKVEEYREKCERLKDLTGLSFFPCSSVVKLYVIVKQGWGRMQTVEQKGSPMTNGHKPVNGRKRDERIVMIGRNY